MDQKGRLAAGKNIETEGKEVQEHDRKEISWHPTPVEQRRLERAINTLGTVDFGTIPLDKTTNDFLVEIIFEGRREAAKDDAVKLFFDFEFDQESVPA
ncbi:hypothetical protein TELCIR_03813 [Teladorsagia circumcincta]|uniref:Uncharacterized protein n=1 Tax=Teladorsagia circumcincta TaxID=45464 RepID=A0A2G9UVJ6_TELCI|nr:hypothetical protein TELCIR_03813 [Teladorsagia circumcincta]